MRSLILALCAMVLLAAPSVHAQQIDGQAGGDISLSGTGHTQTTNLTTDPSFTNAAGADFTLQSGSAARDTGTNLSGDGVTTDYLGTTRPQNGVFDIGAYEYPVASRAAGVSGVVRPSGTVRVQ